jgi:hypothetical protein
MFAIILHVAKIVTIMGQSEPKYNVEKEKKSVKRILCSILAIVLLLTLLPMTASAASKKVAPFGNVYQDLNPVYSVPEDKQFVIKLKIGKKPFASFRIESFFSVFADRECTDQLLADIKYDAKANTITIRPDKTSWGMYPRTGVDTSAKRSWGGLQKYYLVINHDIKADTVTKLKTPLRMLFTVGSPVAIPAVAYKQDMDGNMLLTWEPVKGATEYKVYSGSRYKMDLLAKGTFTEFSMTEEKYKESTMNSLVSDLDSYAVTAVVGGKESRLSNIISGEDLDHLSPRAIAYGQDTSWNSDDIDSILELPRSVPVEMHEYIGGDEPYLIKEYSVVWDFRNPLKTEYGNEYYSGKVVGTTFNLRYYAYDGAPSNEDIAAFEASGGGQPANTGAIDITGMIDFDPAPTTPVKPSTTPTDITSNVTPAPAPKPANTLEQAIAKGLMDRNTKISLKDFPEAGDSTVLTDVLYKVITQYPLILDEQSFGFDFANKTLIAKYSNQSKEEITKKQNEIKEKIKTVTSSIITAGMTVEQKEKAIHDWLVQNARYHDEVLQAYMDGEDLEKISSRYAESFNVYGILVDGLGVCQSYAEAFKMLCDAAGVPCVVMTGKLGSVPHAWNMVQLDKMWYHVDVTNNDGEGAIPYAVYNTSDAYVASDYTFSKEFELDKNIALYTSTKNDKDYYFKNGLVASSENELISKLKSNLSAGTNFYIKVSPDIKEATVYDRLKDVFNEVGAEGQNIRYGRMFNILGVMYE